jgi:hypothetical protein
MKFLSLFTGFGWQTKALVLLALLFAAFSSGWRVHAWKTDAALVSSINRTEKVRQNDQKQAGKIIQRVEVEKEVIRYVTKEIIKEIPALPDADHVCFTNQSLSLWNRAITGADNHRTESSSSSEAPETAEADSEAVATVKDVLLNATENIADCKENAASHNALLDRLDELDGKMCYCGQ